MDVENFELSGVLLIRPRIYRDARGFFLESYRRDRYREAGIDCEFVQDNHSASGYGVLRGLHYQSSPGQAKLVRVTAGRIFDVVVDIRPKSPTFGRFIGHYLDAEHHEQLFVPVGFAHGFCVMSERAEVVYKVSTPYAASTECAIRWDDPQLAIDWPITSPIVSERDQEAEAFADFRARMVK